MIEIRAVCTFPTPQRESDIICFPPQWVWSARCLFFVRLLKDNSSDLELLSGKKYPWNPPQPVSN